MKGLLLSLWVNFFYIGEYLAKLQARTWLFRALARLANTLLKMEYWCNFRRDSLLGYFLALVHGLISAPGLHNNLFSCAYYHSCGKQRRRVCTRAGSVSVFKVGFRFLGRFFKSRYRYRFFKISVSVFGFSARTYHCLSNNTIADTIRPPLSP